MIFRRKSVLGLAALAVLGLAAYWLWPHSPQAAGPSPPEIPSSVVDREVQEALSKAREAVLANPGSGQAWGELGLVFRAHELVNQSNICFTEAAARDAENPRWPYLLGLDGLASASPDAMNLLRQAYRLARQPEYQSAARLRLAEAYLDRGENDEAAKLFQEELSRNPGSARARLGLGVLAAGGGDDTAAIDHLTAVMQSPFANRKAAALLAASHRRLGHAEDASRYERLAATSSDEPWPDPFLNEYLSRQTGRTARLMAASALEAQGREPEALAILAEMLKDNPDDRVMVSIGAALVRLKDVGRAEQVLRDVLKRSPDNALARDYLGVALSMQGEGLWGKKQTQQAIPYFTAALVEFRRAAALYPEGKGNLHAGMALKYLGQFPEAAEAYRAAIRTSPHLASTHLALGEVLLQMGKPGEAIPHLEEAIRLAPASDKLARKLLEEARAKE